MNHELNQEMTGRELIDRFERILGAEEPFHHADHVRLAFEYLRAHPVLEALSRFCSALKRFAEARGKPELFHETITFAYFFLIRERMAVGESGEWQDFAQANDDLLAWKGGILENCYSEATLESDLARRVFILPDKSIKPRADSGVV